MTSLRVDHGLPSSAKIQPNPSSSVFKPHPSNDMPNKPLASFLPSLKHSLPFGNDVQVIIRHCHGKHHRHDRFITTASAIITTRRTLQSIRIRTLDEVLIAEPWHVEWEMHNRGIVAQVN
ncbi:hypothetical protein BDN72DRAFT_488856 [Pluteus cervinus]|uniref:Uncharacterized protein n=1 Tax=Pluteus cervinus TaxID=181527 RepID=A0ACD3A620_9AGAR|nr:hypothetical protein BDN72DRAFT_488856 [Pluteus cervinus]